MLFENKFLVKQFSYNFSFLFNIVSENVSLKVMLACTCWIDASCGSCSTVLAGNRFFLKKVIWGYPK